MNRAFVGAAVVSVLCGGVIRPAGAQEYRVGDDVVVVRDAEIRLPEGKADDAGPGMVLKVTAVNGRWLWVSNGKPGWLDSANVIPLDRRAIDHLTRLIRAQPNSARLYSGRAQVWRELGELDIALADYNEAIRLDPQAAAWYNNSGLLWKAKGNLDAALNDYNEALRLDPSATTYNNRGEVWRAKGDLDAALRDYTEAIRLDPKYTFAYINRGLVWKAKGEYDIALKDYDQAIQLDPKYTTPYNNRAWMLATYPDSRFRNGTQAVEDATKACELSAWKDAGDLDTLAAAYAEAGDFPRAVEWQTKAVALAAETDKADVLSRLDLYQAGKPYREVNKP
jgi:tetratricopeptide (TPR) repeat protein